MAGIQRRGIVGQRHVVRAGRPVPGALKMERSFYTRFCYSQFRLGRSLPRYQQDNGIIPREVLLGNAGLFAGERAKLRYFSTCGRPIAFGGTFGLVEVLLLASLASHHSAMCRAAKALAKDSYTALYKAIVFFLFTWHLHVHDVEAKQLLHKEITVCSSIAFLQ